MCVCHSSVDEGAPGASGPGSERECVSEETTGSGQVQ